MFRDDKAGSIEVGKNADLVVFSENMFEVEPEDISQVKVEMTIVGGEIVYTRQLVESTQ